MKNDKFYISEVTGDTPDATLLKQSMVIAAVAAIVFCAINTYYIISDLVRGFWWKDPYGWYNGASILALVASSVAMIVIRFNKKLFANIKILRISLLAFYTVIVGVVTILTFTAQARAVASGGNLELLAEYTGIMLSTYYLLLFMLAPLPDKYDSIYLVTLTVASGVLLWFLPG